jgi:hypothetical protein
MFGSLRVFQELRGLAHAQKFHLPSQEKKTTKAFLQSWTHVA